MSFPLFIRPARTSSATFPTTSRPPSKPPPPRTTTGGGTKILERISRKICLVNLSFSKQINEGDTIVVSLCSYYTEIASMIGSDHYFELINVDIVREKHRHA